MIQRNVCLVKGNTKMGKVLNVSLPPCKSCDTSLPCFKGGCYAQRFYRLRENCRAAWENNWKMVTTDRDRYMAQIHEAIERRKPTLFRWHVAGDIPDLAYLRDIAYLSSWNPGTRALVFTKKYALLGQWLKTKQEKPPNLSIVLSMWPGLDVPPSVFKRFPKAWMRDKKNPDPRIPKGAVTCDGGCERCGLCWGMGPKDSVVFDKH